MLIGTKEHRNPGPYSKPLLIGDPALIRGNTVLGPIIIKAHIKIINKLNNLMYKYKPLDCIKKNAKILQQILTKIYTLKLLFQKF